MVGLESEPHGQALEPYSAMFDSVEGACFAPREVQQENESKMDTFCFVWLPPLRKPKNCLQDPISPLHFCVHETNHQPSGGF